MSFHVRLASLDERLKRVRRQQKIRELRERLGSRDYDNMREAIAMKRQLKRLLNQRTASSLKLTPRQAGRKIQALRDRLKEVTHPALRFSARQEIEEQIRMLMVDQCRWKLENGEYYGREEKQALEDMIRKLFEDLRAAAKYRKDRRHPDFGPHREPTFNYPNIGGE